jgi:hypothetical protein
MEREITSTRDIIEQAGGIDAIVDQINRERSTRQPAHATFDEIAGIEPRLKALFDEVPSIMQGDGEPWWLWSKIKTRMSRLVGWEAENRALSGDYDLVFRTLFAEAERCNPDL